MRTKTLEHLTTTQKIHTYEESNLFPFAILEKTIIGEEKEQTTFTPVLGDKRCIEKEFDDLNSCEEYIANKPYDLIISLFLHITELLGTYKQEQQLKPKNDETK